MLVTDSVLSYYGLYRLSVSNTATMLEKDLLEFQVGDEYFVIVQTGLADCQ